MLNQLIQDQELQNNLYKNGLETVKQREWNAIKNDILQLYD